MSDVAIAVKNLSKSFKIAHQRDGLPGYRTLRDDLIGLPQRMLARWKRNGQLTSETFWALKDVSFEVKKGEVVGIIGRNGTGKSTLLKILSRITEPTSGGADIYGRVGALLEVGTGFHPELTGRENIFMNGAILGMKRVEIRRKFTEIVAFAGIDKFLDTPVKRYSTGMYVRLTEFQQKCLGKMRDVSAAGRTVIFISHSMEVVSRLCPRAIWLHEGQLISDGPSDAVIAKYSDAGDRSAIQT